MKVDDSIFKDEYPINLLENFEVGYSWEYLGNRSVQFACVYDTGPAFLRGLSIYPKMYY